jgi:hypothetical protein
MANNLKPTPLDYRVVIKPPPGDNQIAQQCLQGYIESRSINRQIN